MRFERTVLQIIPALDQGGAERTTLEMTRAIVAAGGNALVATSGGRLIGAVEQAGGRVVLLPVDAKNPFVMLANRDRLARLIAADRIDLIHARSRAPGWSALWAARQTGVPYVATYHGAYEAGTPWKRFYNSSLARADVVIANSDFTARSIRRQFPVGDRLEVIPRGADLAEFNPERVTPAAVAAMRVRWAVENPETVVLLLPGRLTDWKGHRTAIEAMDVLRGGKDRKAGAIGDFQLIFAGVEQGRGHTAASLMRLVDELGLSNMIRRVGHCDDMATAYAAADIVLAPSTRPEAFGRVAVEAGAMERPVVASRHGGAVETIADGETGILITPGSADELAAAIASLAARGDDGRRAIGCAARARIAARYSTAAMTAATLAAYQQLLDRKAALQ